ncbi:MAG: dihydrodipicolinate reductase C-terminal domain-containing protein [Candidatus Acidiferrales bacterium]
MNLAIVGHGKMGRLIEQLAPEYGFSAPLKLSRKDNENGAAITAEAFRGIDVAVEFSAPGAAPGNIERLASIGVNVVVGTTGWFAHLDRARDAVQRNSTGLVWSANYSVGVNMFFRIVAEASRSLAAEPDYGAWAWEIHHAAKKDAPSGTLAQLVEVMGKAGYNRPISVSSNRAGAIPGTHEVGFDSPADTITLRHTARSREGFARGALRAARWLVGRKGFFEFREIIADLE